MTIALKLQNPFSAFPISYDQDGGGRSSIPLSRVEKIDGVDGNAIVTTIRATSSTLGSLPDDIEIIGGNFTTTIPLTTTHKQLGGSTSPMSLARLRALTLELSADPQTTAEIEAESTLSRASVITASMESSAGGSKTYFTDALLEVANPKEKSFFSMYFPTDLPDDTTLTLTITTFSRAATLKIFAASGAPEVLG